MAVRGFLDDAVVLSQVQDVLAVGTMDVASKWPAICARANAAAWADVVSILGRRGYSAAQVLSWDDGAAVQADQALFWALVRGGATKDYDPKLLVMLDRRKDLVDMPVLSGGVLVAPSKSAIGAGVTDTTKDDFSLADDDLQDWYWVGEGGTPPPNWRP